MRLIDADEIQYTEAHIQPKDGALSSKRWPIVLKSVIDDMPTIEAGPARHGKWRLVSTEEMRERKEAFSFFWASDSWMNYECTNCQYMIHNELRGREDGRSPYCPSCGAKMDGETDG